MNDSVLFSLYLFANVCVLYKILAHKFVSYAHNEYLLYFICCYYNIDFGYMQHKEISGFALFWRNRTARETHQRYAPCVNCNGIVFCIHHTHEKRFLFKFYDESHNMRINSFFLEVFCEKCIQLIERGTSSYAKMRRM